MKNKYIMFLFSIICDFVFSALSLFAAFYITGEDFFSSLYKMDEFSIILWPGTLIILLYLFKVYHILWRYSGFGEFLRIIISAIIALGVLFISQMAVFNNNCFKLSIFIITFFLSVSLIILQRSILKLIFAKAKNISKTNDENSYVLSGNIMIIGAGSAGQMIINEIHSKKYLFNCSIKCVIDDDIYKKGQYISGVKIIGGRDMIIDAAEKYKISVIVFAIPNCNSSQKAEILNLCQQTDCKLKIVPSICKMYNLGELTSQIREVEIDDLLGRDPIEINEQSDLEYVKNKCILVTGGGGTIGSELCRQIAAHNPKQLIIFDIYENSAYDIQNELKQTYPSLNLITLIGSVRDTKRLEYVFKTYNPQIVYHAAAHKHVPLMEDSPNETIKNNVFGTYKTANCADKYNVEKFVLISTDKAVNPTNIMGASKRICEMIVQTCNKHSKTEFVAVRFGNVLGSNGSVIPLFKKQISNGGPVTVTDPDIIRYFMTIPEAVSLVLQAGASAKGGEIFVLDMGKPVKILSLAENLIKLSGLRPYKDIKIVFTGLRPGEKLYEELLMSEEGLSATENSLIHIGRPIQFDENEFISILEEMRCVMYDESADIREYVKKIVPTYNPNND